MKFKILLILPLLCLIGMYNFAQTFTNSSSHNFTNGTVYTTTFNVSGVNSGDILRQVNLKFGDGAMYSAELTRAVITLMNPAGTIVTLLDPNNFNTSLSTTDADRKYVDITLRDHAELNTPKGWADATGNYISNAYPFNYGYWRIPTPGAYSNFTGTHNGTWTLSISYPGLSTTYARKYISSELVFGDNFSFTDIRTSKPNQSCDTRQCLQTGEIYLATNTGYPENQAYAPTTMGGCQWNLVANNTAWFYFTPTSSTVKLSVSGMSKKIESVIAWTPNCQGYNLYTCPTEMYQGSANDTKYYKQSYAAGYSQNHGYELTGLTVGQEYLLILDGMDESGGGTSSNFYIEISEGADDGCCDTEIVLSDIAGAINLCEDDNLTESYSVDNIPGADFQWTYSGSATISGNGTNSIVLEDISSGGTLTVVVEDDCGNEIEKSTVIDVNPLPDVEASVESPICEGENIELEASGGVSYSWTNADNSFTSTEQNPVIPNASVGDAGEYTVVVTDANGCTNSATVELEVKPAPIIQYGALEDVLCEGDTLYLGAYGGSAEWTGPDGFTSDDEMPVIPNVTVDNAGVYHVVVWDKYGCSAEGDVEIMVNAGPDFTTVASAYEICEGESVTISVSGESGLNYTWNNGLGGGTSHVVTPTSSTDYIITAANDECEKSDTISITVVPNEIPTFNLPETVCADETFPVLPAVSDNGISGTWTPDVVSLDQSSYTFVPDAAQCPIDPVTYTIEVKELPIPVIDGPSSYCLGTTVSLTTVDSYESYQWSTGSSSSVINNVTAALNPITVTVEDEFGCVGTSAPFVLEEGNEIIVEQIVTICPGDTILVHGNPVHEAAVYEEIFQSEIGCDSISRITVIIEHLEVTIDFDELICEGESFTINANATSGASYNWTSPSGVSYTTPSIDVVNASPDDAGTYQLSVLKGGCELDTSIVIELQPLPLATIDGNTVLCIGETLSLNASGSGDFLWEFPNGTTTTDEQIVVEDVSNSDAGTYILTITENGCTNVMEVEVNVSQGPSLNFSAINPQECGDNGEITFQFNNVPDGDYTLLYDGGSFEVTVVNGTASVVAESGTYQNLTIAIGQCSSEPVDIVINEATFLEAPEIEVFHSCEDNSYAIITNYNSANTYLFNPASAVQTGDSISSTNPGVYEVWYINGGCISDTETFEILPPEGPEMPELDIEQSCEALGSVTIVNYDAANVYTFSDNDLAINEEGTILNGDAGTEYTLTVSNENCEQSIVFVVPTQLDAPDVVIETENGMFEICRGDSLVLTASGADSYVWGDGLGSNENVVVVPTSTTTYSVVGTNSVGCLDSTSVTIVVNENPDVTAIADKYFGCYGTSIDLVAIEADDVSVVWSYNDEIVGEETVYSINPLEADNSGVYTVTVFSDQGCSASLAINVVGEACGITVPESFSPNGDGFNDLFVIDGIEAYPNTELWIYNRWGTEVYYSEDYQNNWDGRSYSKLNVGGNELPEGTYYYLVKLGGFEGQTGQGDIHKGFIYLKR